MKSKVHPTEKTKSALVRRGEVTVGLSSEAMAAWTPRRSGRRGGPRPYSDRAMCDREQQLTGQGPEEAHAPGTGAELHLASLSRAPRHDRPDIPDPDPCLDHRGEEDPFSLHRRAPPWDGLFPVLDDDLPVLGLPRLVGMQARREVQDCPGLSREMPPPFERLPPVEAPRGILPAG